MQSETLWMSIRAGRYHDVCTRARKVRPTNCHPSGRSILLILTNVKCGNSTGIMRCTRRVRSVAASVGCGVIDPRWHLHWHHGGHMAYISHAACPRSGIDIGLGCNTSINGQGHGNGDQIPVPNSPPSTKRPTVTPSLFPLVTIQTLNRGPRRRTTSGALP